MGRFIIVVLLGAALFAGAAVYFHLFDVGAIIPVPQGGGVAPGRPGDAD